MSVIGEAITSVRATLSASGEFTLATKTDTPFTITHNLGSKKILLIVQRINEDGSDVYSDDNSPYRHIAGTFLTPEAAGFNSVQDYKTKEGWETAKFVTSSTPPVRYQLATGYYLPVSQSMSFCSVQCFYGERNSDFFYTRALDDNSVSITFRYRMTSGRWLWKACVCDLEDWDEV